MQWKMYQADESRDIEGYARKVLIVQLGLRVWKISHSFPVCLINHILKC